MNTSIWPQDLLMLALIMVGPFKKGYVNEKKVGNQKYEPL